MLFRNSSFFFLSICLLVGCTPKDYNTLEMRLENSVSDSEFFYEYPEIPDRELTLADVIAITLSQNLDILAQLDELAAQEAISKAEQYKMIPPLTVDGILAARSNSTATRVLSNGVFLPPQTSVPKETRQWDIRMTLNFLDLGMAYFRTKQERGRTLILDNQQMRIRQKLIFDTVQAYWRAIIAQKTLQRAQDIVLQAKGLQRELEKQIAKRNVSSIVGLQQESRLIEMENRLFIIKYQYENAKAELTEHMGLPPGTEIFLADVELNCEDPCFDPMDILEKQALLSRPELVVKDVEERIAQEEVKMALLQMLPNAAIYGDYNADLNPFLVHNYWLSAGIKAAWNLLSFPLHLAERKVGKEREAQAIRARIALSVAILTEVHISYINYLSMKEQMEIAQNYADVKKRLFHAALKEKSSGEFNELDTINYAEQALIAEIAALKTFSDYQIAIEQLDFSIGRPLYYLPICPVICPQSKDVCYDVPD